MLPVFVMLESIYTLSMYLVDNANVENYSTYQNLKKNILAFIQTGAYTFYQGFSKMPRAK
jgi:hypothetical protein